MSGGLMQLVAYGAQDVYLTGNPQITFFKVVYRRHTNFSMESIEQSFNGTADFGNKVSCTVSRNGDLINRMYVETTLPALQETKEIYTQAKQTAVSEDGNLTINNTPVTLLGGSVEIQQHPGPSKHFKIHQDPVQPDEDGNLPPNNNPIVLQMRADEIGGWQNVNVGDVLYSASNEWINNVGFALLKTVVLEIGGQKIDSHSAQWMHVWNELTVSEGHRDAMDQMVGNKIGGSATATSIMIPLQFWFCRNPGLSLPLIALQYHEVKVNIEFESLAKLNKNNVTGLSLTNTSLWVDYVYLDTDERRRFAQSSHEYLIEQVQEQIESITNNNPGQATVTNLRLNFNHPCKELIWGCSNGGITTFSNQNGDNPIQSAMLKLNGHDRFAERSGDYFNLVQPHTSHTNIPVGSGINVYSFATKPEDHQPSGTCNFSRIDNAQLVLNSAASGNIYVWAVNYNVLRIMSGMGGLAFSN
jgi:hypothetical protein